MKDKLYRLISFILYRIVYLFGNLIFIIFFRRIVRGKYFVPRKGPLIVASNHASYLDPPLIGCSMPREIYFLARQTLMDSPIQNALFGALNSIPMDRDKGDIKALKTAVKTINEGKAILLFPEGTRTLNGAIQEGKTGIGFIAHKTRVPILPVYCDGTYNILPKGAKYPKFHKIHVYFGEPLHFEHYYQQKGNQEIYQSITNQIMIAIKALHQQCTKDKV